METNQQQNNGFWFGLLMGGLAGSAALYFLGTEHGRERLRKILDVMEHLDDDVLQELKQKAEEHAGENPGHIVSDIHSVLDKIESTIPSKKEVQKYFSKNGKSVK